MEQVLADPLYYWVLVAWNLLIAWVLVSYKKLTSWIPKLLVTCFIWPCAWALVVIAYNLVFGESGRWRYDNYVFDLLYQVSEVMGLAGSRECCGFGTYQRCYPSDGFLVEE